MQSFIMNLHEVFIHIHQGCFAGTGAIVRLPQCQWSKPDRYGKISQCITTTKHSKAKTVCIFLGIYCMYYTYHELQSLIARFMGPTWGLPGDDRTLVGPMLAQWTLLSGMPYGSSDCGHVFPLEEVPYCSSRSSVKFQGHMVKKKIVDFDPNWPFPNCSSSLNSPLAMQWRTKVEAA